MLLQTHTIVSCDGCILTAMRTRILCIYSVCKSTGQKQRLLQSVQLQSQRIKRGNNRPEYELRVERPGN